jgi:hypothetical protein
VVIASRAARVPIPLDSGAMVRQDARRPFAGEESMLHRATLLDAKGQTAVEVDASWVELPS